MVYTLDFVDSFAFNRSHQRKSGDNIPVVFIIKVITSQLVTSIQQQCLTTSWKLF